MNTSPETTSSNVIHSVDIAVCTWNRSALLAKTLDSFAGLNVPNELKLRILVVDNNSTDDTEQVIQSFSDSMFGKAHSILALTESNQGHTYSRNCAISQANSDLMIWTDDDVSVPANWVESYVAAANQNPEVNFWGGEINPSFESGKPKWIADNWGILKGCFAAREFEGDLELDGTRLPYGANFAIRTYVQKEFQYNEDLGRRGDEVLGEDELDLFRRLLKAGHRAQWVPNNSVEHFIPKDRSTEEYIYDYFVGQGRALVAKGNPWHTDLGKFQAESKSEYRKYKLKRRISRSNVWVSHMLRGALAQGQFEAGEQST